MRKWELWVGDDGTWFFPASSEKARTMARAAGALKTWETQASSSNDAMRAQYEHLGFEPYQPMLREDGTPYPEDEDDAVLREQEGESFDAPWTAHCPTARKVVVIPGHHDPDDVLRQGRLDYVCPACHESHSVLFKRQAPGDSP